MLEIFSHFKGGERSLRTEGWKRQTLFFFLLPVTLKVEGARSKIPTCIRLHLGKNQLQSLLDDEIIWHFIFNARQGVGSAVWIWALRLLWLWTNYLSSCLSFVLYNVGWWERPWWPRGWASELTMQGAGQGTSSHMLRLRVHMLQLRPSTNQCLKENKTRDFLGGPVVKTPYFQRRGCGVNPWSGN